VNVIGRAATFARSRGRIRIGLVAGDCALLVAVTAVSVLPYVRGLGFYYDDYPVIERMRSATDQSLFGLYHSIRPLTGQRPLQALIFAALYRLFGVHPLGYHIVNACLLAAVAVLFYLVLRELRLPRLVCVAVPLVYTTLPHYATNRFWMDAFQINLSGVFYFLSLYAGLRAVRARRAALPAWVLLAAVCVAGSLFAYEVAFPLFAVSLALLWRAHRSAAGTAVNGWVAIGGLTAAIVAAGVVKTLLVAEHGQNAYRIGVQDGFAHHLAYLVSGSIKVNVGTYLLALPYVVEWTLQHQTTASDAAAAVAAGLVALLYVRRITAGERDLFADSRLWRNLAGAGCIVFVLGYAIFVTNQRVLFRSAGIDNRVNAAAALGVAALLVAGFGWLAARLPDARRVAFFSAAVGSTVAIGVLIVDGLGGFWTRAANEQHTIVNSLRAGHPSLPPASTIILDGVCPEAGPAVVFADEWDFRAELQLAYNSPTLVADTATEALRAGDGRLALTMTFLGARSTRTYPYGPRLFVYDFPRRELEPIRNGAEARRYVSARRPLDCPPQRGFAWGFDPFSRTSLP
jgi:hypothetical protein